MKNLPLIFQENLVEFIVCGTHTRWRGTLGAQPQCKYNTSVVHTQCTVHWVECVVHRPVSFKTTKSPKFFINGPQNWRGSPTTFTIDT